MLTQGRNFLNFGFLSGAGAEIAIIKVPGAEFLYEISLEKLKILKTPILHNFKNLSFQKFPANLEIMHFSCKILQAA